MSDKLDGEEEAKSEEAEPQEAPPAKKPEPTIEELHAELASMKRDMFDMNIHVTNKERQLSKALGRIGARQREEIKIERRAERAAVPNPPQNEPKKKPPRPIPEFLRNLAAVYCGTMSTLSVVLALVLPLWLDATQIPAWIPIAAVIAAAVFIAFLFCVFLLSVFAIGISVLFSRKAAPQPQPLEQTDTPAPSTAGWELLHDMPLNKGVPVYDERDAIPRGGNLSDDPDVTTYLKGIESGEVTEDMQYSEFLAKKRGDIDPNVF